MHQMRGRYMRPLLLGCNYDGAVVRRIIESPFRIHKQIDNARMFTCFLSYYPRASVWKGRPVMCAVRRLWWRLAADCNPVARADKLWARLPDGL